MDKRNRMSLEEQELLKKNVNDKKKLMNEMFTHIRSQNKYLNNDILIEMGIRRLLALCHPLYRGEYAKRLMKIDLLDESIVRKIELSEAKEKRAEGFLSNMFSNQ